MVRGSWRNGTSGGDDCQWEYHPVILGTSHPWGYYPLSTPRITPGPTDIQPLPSPTPTTAETASPTPATAEPPAEVSPPEASPGETSPPVAGESPVVEETNPVITPTIEPPTIAPATIDPPAIAPEEIAPPSPEVEPTLTTPEPVPPLLVETPRQPEEPPLFPIPQEITETVRSAIEQNSSEGNQGPALGNFPESVAQNIDTGMGAMEQVFTDSFSQHNGISPGPMVSLTQAQTLMGNIEAETGVKPALIYVMPSLSLTDTRYADIKTREVLAMGASEFTELDPLPAVPIEVETITTKVRKGQGFINELFTLENLKQERREHQYSIVHLGDSNK